ncbi:hypothetical protein FQN53_001770 [Emmonsiellopsis sp. PD_33]|nr:hypothetical protein FQN53_001770 [Emmonsiellopsis sp. PD_33]
MDWTTALAGTAYWIVYPITILARILLALLSLLVMPLRHAALFLVWVCMLPLRLLAKFEPLLIYLSVAGTLGVSAGIFLFFLSGYIYQFLDIASDDQIHESHTYQHNKTIFSKSKPREIKDTNNGNVTTTVLGKPNLHEMRARDAEEEMEAKIQRSKQRLSGFKKELGMYPADWAMKKPGRDRRKEKEGLFSTMILEEEDNGEMSEEE